MVRSHLHFAVAFLVLAVSTWAAPAGRANDPVPDASPIPETSPTGAKGVSASVGSAPKIMPTQPAPSSVNEVSYPPESAGGIRVQEAPDDGPPGAVYEEPHWLERLNPFHALDPTRPVTVAELCCRLDCVADKLRNEGLVAIKQPDVFSQARLTRFRYDFDQQLSSDLGNFHLVLAARINRLDAATTTQTTALSAALAAPGTTAVKVPDLPDLSKINANVTSLFGSTIDMTKGPFGSLSLAPSTLAQSGAASAALGLGVDPTVYLDEKKRFLEHLNHIRRLNLGPDQNDSSGYGLYLLRLPVSITPGLCTSQGYGAEVAVKVEHEFSANFVQSTFRNLVINDLVDQLGPFIYEVIRFDRILPQLEALHYAVIRKRELDRELEAKKHALESPMHALDTQRDNLEKQERNLRSRSGEKPASSEARKSLEETLELYKKAQNGVEKAQNDVEKAQNDVEKARNDVEKVKSDVLRIRNDLDLSRIGISVPSTRRPKQMYPVAPNEILQFFLHENIYQIAKDVKKLSIYKTPREIDVRMYLRHMLAASYATMSISGSEWGREDAPPAPLDNTYLLDRIRNAAYERKFRQPGEDSELTCLFQDLINEIKPTRDNIEDEDGSPRPRASLCWAIALDAACLDKYMQLYMQATMQSSTHAIPGETHFYRVATLDQSAIDLFQEFVRVKWPIITFALDPVTDQQNIADSFNLKRDLQLAVSFAFATGQIGFNQLTTFRRQIEQSADTIALNRTVTGFVHGSDVFGYRFTPRFQNPPAQRTNLGVIASQLIGGGPGPDYQIKKSKLEPGIRELTAIVLLPTFLPVMRMNVTGNWFRLNDPEHLVYHTRRQMEDGRRVQQVRQAVLCDPRLHEYRADDLRVLHAKLDMLDAMLPTQSKVIQLPYENTASGFGLFSDFSEGATALVPELTGFSGVDVIQPPAGAATAATTAPAAGTPGLQVSATTTGTATFTTTSIVGGTGSMADLFVFGKYISLLDTKVIAGGRSAAYEILSREVIHVQVPANAIPTTTEDGKTYIEIFLATPNGASNSLLVPYQATAVPLVAFDLKIDSQSEDVYYQWLGQSGSQSLVATYDPTTKKTINISWDSPTSIAPRTLRVRFYGTINAQPITFDLTADQGANGDYTVSLQQFTVKLLRVLQSMTTPGASVTSPITFTVWVQPWAPNDAQGFRVRPEMKKLKSQLSVNMYFNATGKNALPDVLIPPEPEPTQKPQASDSTSLRVPASRSGQAPIAAARRAQDTSVVKAAQTLPTPPASLSAPQPPAQLTPPVLLSPAVTNEAEQVARMLTGRPFDPNTASSPPPLPPGTIPAPGAATTPAQTAISALPASGAQPIIVLPAPVVVVPSKPDEKKHHKMHYRPGQLMRNLGNHINQALPGGS
ncbi:MAG: hypothetical protein ACLP7Q_26365 [Isosphaeraceae bacterium]